MISLEVARIEGEEVAKTGQWVSQGPYDVTTFHDLRRA